MVVPHIAAWKHSAKGNVQWFMVTFKEVLLRNFYREKAVSWNDFIRCCVYASAHSEVLFQLHWKACAASLLFYEILQTFSRVCLPITYFCDLHLKIKQKLDILLCDSPRDTRILLFYPLFSLEIRLDIILNFPSDYHSLIIISPKTHFNLSQFFWKIELKPFTARSP